MCESRGIMGNCAYMFFHRMLARLDHACFMIYGLGKFCLSHGMTDGKNTTFVNAILKQFDVQEMTQGFNKS